MKICPECSKEHNDPRRRRCITCSVRGSRKNLKSRAVEYKGGKCEKCGYSKCLKALHFHHLDPSKKDFHVTAANYHAWHKVKEELDKCVLLCANCHAEEHDKEN